MKTYRIKTKHDKGFSTFKVIAADKQRAKLIVCNLELCPESAIISIKVKRENKYEYLFVVQGNYGYGWEDLIASEDEQEANNDLKAYRENDPAPTRLINRRVLKESK